MGFEHALQVTDPALGLAEAVSQTDLQRTFTVCLGDHSCGCSYFIGQSAAICKHVEAVAVLCPFTLDMREATARHLISCGRLRPIKSSHGCMFEVGTLANDRVTYVCNTDSGVCSCPDWNAHERMCCHLLAAAEQQSTDGRRPAYYLLQLAAHSAKKPIIVRRCFPQNAATGGGAICAEFSSSMQTELLDLRQFETRTAAAQSRAQLSKAHKAALSLCRNIGSKLHTLDSAVLDEVLPMLQRACAVVDMLAPKLLPTLRAAQKGDARKDSDRTHKPLFPNRKRPAAAIACAERTLKRGKPAPAQLPSNLEAAPSSRNAVAERIVRKAPKQSIQRASPGGSAAPLKLVASKPQGRPHKAVPSLRSCLVAVINIESALSARC